MPVAEIVSVGTELLMGQIVDTNARALAAVLPEYGFICRFRQTVGDNLARLTDALRLALSRSDVVFTIGGLGPTEDDLTRDGVAAALGQTLETDPEMARKLEAMMRSRNLPMQPAQMRQAEKPAGASFIDNPNGSAPGLICPGEGKTILCMPGPPSEFLPMLDGAVRAWLESRSGNGALVSQTIKTAGVGEAAIEERIRDLLACANPTIGVYAHPGETHLRLSAWGDDAAAARAILEPFAVAVRARLHGADYGTDSDTLESKVLDLLRKSGQTLVTAESCTGGLLGQRITSVPGSSDAYLGGVVSYSNQLKRDLLGVTEADLDAFGAVSAEVACAMASGARDRLGGDWALSVTGVAGPGGGTEAKPVGLVFIGIAGPDGVEAHRYHFRGIRDFVRVRSAAAALTLLWQALRD